MKKNKSRLTWFVVALLFAFGIGYLMFSGEDASSKDAKPKSTSGMMTFNGAEIKETKDGVDIWTLKAETIQVDSKTKDIVLMNMTGTFVQDGVTLTLTAPQGKVDEARSRVELSGGIRAESTDGTVLTTGAMVFNNADKTFRSTERFVYKKNGMMLEGDSLEGNLILRQIRAKGNARLISEGR